MKKQLATLNRCTVLDELVELHAVNEAQGAELRCENVWAASGKVATLKARGLPNAVADT